MKNERILISGASIAGQTLAYWLARHGFRPTMVERAPHPRSGGQGVDVRDQAIQVAERMGVMPQIRAAAADVAGMRFVDARDRGLARIDMSGIQDKYGSGEVEIMRGDLVGILHNANADPVEYLFGDSIRSLEQDDDGVAVAFENGRPRRFDLVIGADGMHSNVRGLVFGPESRFVHHMDHYFAFGNADSAHGQDRTMTVFNTPGTMAGVYRSGNHAQAKAYFMFRSPQRDYDHRDPAAERHLLTDAFADRTEWRIPELLAGALADPDLYVDALSQVRMDSWTTGRIALVGDAAYCASPASGAGAELSLIGAYRLAGELAAAGGDHRTAFRRYEETHRESVDRKQKIGPNLRLMAPKTRIGMAVRNTIARSPLLESLAGLERIMAPSTTAALPEYRPAPSTSAI
ncbi:FAD-dependent monooxygenase [Nocardia sp. NPDC057440]|uniref:FAD-dependent monooxygenase n=1 Tax=Nocardia sp. NPDC057440 TaxID=3346134 RepID=UPI00366D9D72